MVRQEELNIKQLLAGAIASIFNGRTQVVFEIWLRQYELLQIVKNIPGEILCLVPLEQFPYILLLQREERMPKTDRSLTNQLWEAIRERAVKIKMTGRPAKNSLDHARRWTSNRHRSIDGSAQSAHIHTPLFKLCCSNSIGWVPKVACRK